jgi:NADPH:quinone reductase-like Zn-dependent oxidoreductase
MSMKAVVFDRFGDPAEVLHVRDVPVPEPGPGRVRVRMRACPINPSDLLTVRGAYGRLPELPATPGFEGVGVVEARGPGLLGKLRMGKRVAVLHGQGGTWQEHVVVPARQVVPVPPEVSDEQAAPFFVNPASALVMTRYVLRVPPGAWLLQTAAGSALGRMVIRLGRQYGFHTLNVVRRREQAEELRAAGGDAVVCTAEESIPDRAFAVTGGAGAPFAIDAVGGETGSEVVRALAPEGRMLVYGTLADQPIRLDPRALMVGHKCVEGFWLSEWVRRQGVLTMLGLIRQIRKLLRSGVLTSAIAGTFPPEQIREAVRLAEAPGKPGKVLLKFDGA